MNRNYPFTTSNRGSLVLNKYNSAAEVNLLELLDDDIGLGNPYEKNLNDTPRTDKTFNHYMDFLIDTAIKQGKKEVVLADSDIEYISNLVQTKHNKLREFSGSLELCVKICSSSISTTLRIRAVRSSCYERHNGQKVGVINGEKTSK